MAGRREQPKTTAQRFDEQRADYAAANESRLRRKRIGVIPDGSGADYHVRNESKFYGLIEQARAMRRDDCIVGLMVERSTDNVIQNGFFLDHTTGDPGLDVNLKARWKDWSEDPMQADFAQERTFHGLETAIHGAELIDGDSWAILTEDGGIQINEAHRLKTPRNTTKNVVLGVKLDQYRRREQIWVTKDEIDPLSVVNRVGDMQQYPVFLDDEFPADSTPISGRTRVACQVYDPKRVTQTRGVTALAPIIDLCGMFEDINFAQLVKAQQAACWGIVWKNSQWAEGGAPPTKGDRENEQGATNVRILESQAPGMEIDAPYGKEPVFLTPNIPGSDFFPHARLTIQLCALNFGIPIIIVMMDASETNFSGWRGAFDQAKIGFRRIQKRRIEQFHRPVYIWKLKQWLSEDTAEGRMLRQARARLGDRKFFAHIWKPPVWPYIQPMEDVGSNLLKLKSGQTSPRRFHSELSQDHDEILAETIEDNVKAIRAAKTAAMAINEEFADDQPVHWREVVCLPLPEGLTVTPPMPPSILKAQEQASKPAAQPSRNGSRKAAMASANGRFNFGDNGE